VYLPHTIVHFTGQHGINVSSYFPAPFAQNKRWESLSSLVNSVQGQARVYHYLTMSVITPESILICLYLESGMDEMEIPNIDSMIPYVHILIFHL
jgi:hypothetical protein